MLTTLLAITLLHWIVLVTPGANVLVVVNMAASGQRKAACFAAAGVTTVARDLVCFGPSWVWEPFFWLCPLCES